MKYLPTGRRLAIHFIALIAFACLLGPLLGSWLTNMINPPKAWGYIYGIGDYTPMNVMIWGFAFLMFEVFFYTGWLIKQGHRDWKKQQPKTWYN
jgi:hypothetical protein